MVDFKDEAKNLVSTLNMDPNHTHGFLTVFSKQLIKGVEEAKNRQTTFTQWLAIGLKCLYPNVEFIPASEGDFTECDSLKEWCARKGYKALCYWDLNEDAGDNCVRCPVWLR